MLSKQYLCELCASLSEHLVQPCGKTLFEKSCSTLFEMVCSRDPVQVDCMALFTGILPSSSIHLVRRLVHALVRRFVGPCTRLRQSLGQSGHQMPLAREGQVGCVVQDRFNDRR